MNWLRNILSPRGIEGPVISSGGIPPHHRDGGPLYYYDGVLSAQTAAWCRDMLRKYPYAVELSERPISDYKGILKEHEVWEESEYEPGKMYPRKTQLWGTCPKEMTRERKENGQTLDRGAFMFFADSEDHEVFCNVFRDYVVNKQPFRMAI